MSNSGDPFIITVILSKVFSGKKETKFSMLIDYAKMTIVYEVIERIRWMFSLTGCLSLVHGDSIIHELEDINILAVLKTFEIKPCPDNECHHEKLYKNILSEIDFYTLWHNKKVPKFFANNLELIKDKLCFRNLSEAKSKELPDISMNPTDIFNKKSNPLISKLMDTKVCANDCTNLTLKSQNNFNKQQASSSIGINDVNSPELDSQGLDTKEVNIQNNTPSAISSVNKPDSPFFKNISDAKLTKSNTKSPSKVNISKAMEIQDPSFIVKTNPNNSVHADKRNTSLNVVQTKRRNYIKPFSLGEVVAILRNDTQKGLCKSLEHEKSDNEIAENEEETETVKKKRKRTRKNKVKKKSFPQMEDQMLNFPLIPAELNLNPVENKKSSHIRFNSNSEDDESNVQESNIFSTSNENYDKDGYIKQCGLTSPNNTNHLPKSLDIQQEKKQVFSSPLNSNINSDQIMDCTPAIDPKPIQREEDLIFLGSQMSEEFQNSLNVSKSLVQPVASSLENELSLLKHKVPFPTVFERFC